LLFDFYARTVNITTTIFTTKAQIRHTDESASQKRLTAKLRHKKAPWHVRTGSARVRAGHVHGGAADGAGGGAEGAESTGRGDGLE
jgi:hypothetical protein